MIKPINKDILFLQQKAEPATQADTAVMRDLRDTMQAHQTDCAGMAANMIGVNKRIIIVNLGMTNLLMLNPVILKNPASMKRQKAVCLCRESVRARAIKKSRWSIRTSA